MKRLFFGLSLQAPWPPFYPKGRLIEEETRHITLAFLGNHPFDKLENALNDFPKPDFLIGPVGRSDEILFLPKGHPRVVSHHISWIVDGEKIKAFQKKVQAWLESLEYPVDRRPLLPHVTLARAPFSKEDWEKAFEPLPMIITGVHLYESLGNLQYQSLWELPFISSFEEFEHTADIAFHIRGTSMQELYLHAAIGMSFHFPPFLSFLQKIEIVDLEGVIRALNVMISTCDLEMGCPFKAVSYHGKIREEENQILHWEMVVDV